MEITPVESLEIDNCYSIEVTGGSSTTRGIYFKTEEYVESAPENPVWKHQENDRYIFNTGSSRGWRIGKKDHLATGKSYYSSKSDTLPYASQKFTKKDGRFVEVKCQKKVGEKDCRAVDGP